MRFYGMTFEDYNKLLDLQQGVCAICKLPPSTIALDIDHDHATGQVRGLLCRNCNTRLGWYQKHITNVLTYIENSQERQVSWKS